MYISSTSRHAEIIESNLPLVMNYTPRSADLVNRFIFVIGKCVLYIVKDLFIGVKAKELI